MTRKSFSNRVVTIIFKPCQALLLDAAENDNQEAFQQAVENLGDAKRNLEKLFPDGMGKDKYIKADAEKLFVEVEC